MKRTILAIGVLLASAAAANASGYGDSSNRRDYNEQLRIQRGLRDGSLTRHEYYRLEAEQGQIRALEARARRDGVVTPYERYEIRRAQNQASRDIYRERHDDQTRYWHPGW